MPIKARQRLKYGIFAQTNYTILCQYQIYSTVDFAKETADTLHRLSAWLWTITTLARQNKNSSTLWHTASTFQKKNTSKFWPILKNFQLIRLTCTPNAWSACTI